MTFTEGHMTSVWYQMEYDLHCTIQLLTTGPEDVSVCQTFKAFVH